VTATEKKINEAKLLHKGLQFSQELNDNWSQTPTYRTMNSGGR